MKIDRTYRDAYTIISRIIIIIAHIFKIYLNMPDWYY